MATVVVHLEGQPDAYGPLTHQFRNFGETVFGWVRDNKLGSVDIDEVDRSTNRFSIRDVKAAKLRHLTRWVEEEAARQFLTITTETSA
ncbi:hypothetical protein [Devosia lacusdianchii]|uniref:hypothetical protein n=1 Tax=Devosia lacusdianchii TaxID=2917991 RepID=UPI001F061CEE|nr:hypothetical protein [Devosia sp. JXJ CY 41]